MDAAGDLEGGLAYRLAVPLDGCLQGVAEIAEEMPTVRDLDRRGRTAPDPISVSACSIASDHLDPRVPTQPVGDGAGFAVGPACCKEAQREKETLDFPPGSGGSANEPEHPRRAGWRRSGTRRRFTAEFKAEAVKRLLEGGKGLGEVATELGLSPGQLSGWRNEHLAAGSAEALAQRKAEQAETQRLKREVKRLEEEVEILKKAAAFFARGIA